MVADVSVAVLERLALDVDDLDTTYVLVGGVDCYENDDATWQVWDQGLPDTLVYCLGQVDGGGPLFCGTETSAYRRDDGGTWVDITGNEAPVTIYWSVEALNDGNTMRFGLRRAFS